MQRYKLKRGFKPETERIYSAMQECFPTEVSRDEAFIKTSYGAMLEVKVWIENKMLCVETVSDTTVKDDETILKTNKAYRDFLFKATGYTAKERLKQAKKEVNGA